ncbi:enoyl-CoA hydratase-related protein [Jatrophihabitans sp.]|uniref:enoyl-CoA hydratase-related protein n=1 Tax=Jatrophihabitans sp. TaxID=1932789 RepID=UPI0030C68771|nr:Enoyl CoA dehydratase/isomerase [Jatrophihabitans sp.]
MSRTPTVAVTRSGHVLTITLDRPAKRNAIGRQMADELDAALRTLDDDPDLWVGVLRANGPVFCAGSDLTADGDYLTPAGGEYGLIRRARSTPLIAVVEGPALGGGLEVVLACDLVVASDNASFGLPEVRRGLVPACAGLFRGPRALPVNLARQLVLTGTPITAQRAAEAGLVNVLTETGRAHLAAEQLAAEIIANSPTAVRACLRALQDVLGADDALGWAATDLARATVGPSLDRAEGVRAFLEKREPRWSGT